MTWKNASSIILAARTGMKSNVKHTNNNCDYQILCMRRHQKSSFMAGAYVFPGGMIEPADADLQWINLYSSFGFNDQSFKTFFPKSETRSDILSAGKDELSKEISLRITTIRETFEECGILLCRSKFDNDQSCWAKHLKLIQSEIQLWQQQVQNDARLFYEMCKKFKCYPDLWSLHKWSNWLTPTTYKKRFDTHFFFACIDGIPHTNYSTNEVEHLMWGSPSKLVKKFDSQLPPPQFYELSNIMKFNTLDELNQLAKKRNKLGIKLIFPVISNLSDGNVMLLPGDSAYPKNPNKENEPSISLHNQSILDFRHSSQILNRIEIHSNKNNKKIIACNFIDE